MGARWSRWVVVASVALVSAVQLLPDPAYDGVVLGLVAAGLLAGLPHGALDHRIGAVLTGGRRPSSRRGTRWWPRLPCCC